MTPGRISKWLMACAGLAVAACSGRLIIDRSPGAGGASDRADAYAGAESAGGDSADAAIGAGGTFAGGAFGGSIEAGTGIGGFSPGAGGAAGSGGALTICPGR